MYCDAPTKRCSSPIEPHFLGARYFVFMEPTGTCVCASLIKRCSSPIEPHFLRAGCCLTGEAHSFIGEVLRF